MIGPATIQKTSGTSRLNTQLRLRASAHWNSCAFGSCLLPKVLRRVQRIHVEVLPPTEFVTPPVKLAMMKPAEWDGEFVTHFAPECPLLSKPKVMRIRRAATARQTGLGGHKP